MGKAELRARVLSARRSLPGRTIHVWRTALSAITPLAEEIKALLSADEQLHADKFRGPTTYKTCTRYFFTGAFAVDRGV